MQSFRPGRAQPDSRPGRGEAAPIAACPAGSAERSRHGNHAAVVEAERVLGIEELRDDCGELALVDETTGEVIDMVPASIAVASCNGSCFRGETYQSAFAGDDPVLRAVEACVASRRLMRGEHMTGTGRGPQPQRYEICIRGCLGPTLRSAFPAFQARARGGDTILAGVLADQAALYGVLAEIEALGLELIEVRRLPPHRPRDRS